VLSTSQRGCIPLRGVNKSLILGQESESGFFSAIDGVVVWSPKFCNPELESKSHQIQGLCIDGCYSRLQQSVAVITLLFFTECTCAGLSKKADTRETVWVSTFLDHPVYAALTYYNIFSYGLQVLSSLHCLYQSFYVKKQLKFILTTHLNNIFLA